MALDTRMSDTETSTGNVSEAYEAPTLLKHGSLRDLTLESIKISTGGSPWCGGGEGGSPWGPA